MERPMIGFTADADGHWVALLGCGHRQHVRHDPPLAERPWVTSEEGRRAKIGQSLDCVRCDAFELPDGCVVYKRTDVFTETTTPAALRTDHATKAGVWARIVVDQGRLGYVVHPPIARAFELAPGTPGIVVPEVRHHVVPIDRVRFHVEFLRVAREPT
jgi:tellurite methyltransferase